MSRSARIMPGSGRTSRADSGLDMPKRLDKGCGIERRNFNYAIDATDRGGDYGAAGGLGGEERSWAVFDQGGLNDCERSVQRGGAAHRDITPEIFAFDIAALG